MSKILGFKVHKQNNISIEKKLAGMSASFGFGKVYSIIKKDCGIGYVDPLSEGENALKSNLFEKEGVSICVSGYFDLPPDKRHSFAEHIFNLYSKKGEGFAVSLNGSFSACIYDSNKKKLLIASDRYSSRPIYYYSGKTFFVFGSEIKALLAAGIEKEIEWAYWKDYFSYGFGLGTKTPFKGVKSIPNGSVLTVQNGSVNITRYWDYDFVKIKKRTLNQTVRLGVKILRNIFEKQKLNGDASVLLSGGYDSRCIIGALKKFSGIHPKVYIMSRTYSLPNPPLGDADSSYAQIVCDRLNVPYEMVGAPDSLYRDNFIKTIFLLDGLTSEHIWITPLIKEMDFQTIKFEGFIGDIFMRAGWLSFTELASPGLNNEILASRLHRRMMSESGFDTDTIISLFEGPELKNIIPSSNEVLSELKMIPDYPYKIKSFHSKNRTKNTITLTSNNFLMRKSLVKFPFCDNEFADFALSINPCLKINNNIYKRILDEAFPCFADIPTTNDPKTFKVRAKDFLLGLNLKYIVYIVSVVKRKTSEIFGHASKNQFVFKLDENPRDVDYLFELASEIPIPKFINKKRLTNVLNEYRKKNIDPTYFLEPILVFCAWHALFYEEDHDFIRRHLK